MDDEPATLDGQYYEFAKLFDNKRPGTHITLYRNDYWMRQSKILEDRKLTMTDTGICWWKWSVDEIAPATLDGQFFAFSKLMDYKGPGTHITLYMSDYWMRQAKVLDDRHLTMTDTGVVWWKWEKTEMDWEEWNDFLKCLCLYKSLDHHQITDELTNCGLPGTCLVEVPAYRTFFTSYRSKNAMIFDETPKNRF